MQAYWLPTPCKTCLLPGKEHWTLMPKDKATKLARAGKQDKPLKRKKAKDAGSILKPSIKDKPTSGTKPRKNSKKMKTRVVLVSTLIFVAEMPRSLLS